jgi:hypothetical protein
MDNIKTHDELVEIISNNIELINTAFTENKGVIIDNKYAIRKNNDNSYTVYSPNGYASHITL